MKRAYLAPALLALAIGGNPVLAQAPAAPAPAAALPDIDVFGPGIRVTDTARSVKFYVDGLGLAILQKLMEGKTIVTLLAPKGRTAPPFIDLLQTEPDPAKATPVIMGDGLNRIILSVADSKTVHARLDAMGYKPGALGASGIFFVKDPDGYSLEITQRRPPAPPPK